jgi:hypothetical protein
MARLMMNEIVIGHDAPQIMGQILYKDPQSVL